MNITEAQKFTARWSKILVPWAARTEAEAVRHMERSCLGVMMGMTLMLGLSHYHASPVRWILSIAALLVFVMALWLSFRLRQVRRLFDAAGTQSFTDLKKDATSEV